MPRSAFRVRMMVGVAGLLAMVWGVEATLRGSEVFVPSVARSPGAAGSLWYTTLWVHNPNQETAHLSLSLLRRGQANPNPEQQLLSVQPGQTLTVTDLLWDLFGLESAAGALRVKGDRQVAVSARIFNLQGGDLAESQGQFMAGLPAEIAVAAGGSTDIAGVALPADETFRCNFALVETVGKSVVVDLSLHDGAGTVLAAASYTLGPWQAMQRNLSELAPGVSVDNGRLHVAHGGGDGEVLAVASLVANGVASQDPSTLEMEASLSPPTGSSGIESVVAGGGLRGGGPGPEVLLEVGAGPGLEVTENAVGIAQGAIRGSMVADGELVRGLQVGDQIMRDTVQLSAGPGLTLTSDGGSLVTMGVDVGFSQIELKVDAASGAWTTARAVGVPYSTRQGNWHLRLNISGRSWSPTSSVTLMVEGVVFKDVSTYSQPLASYLGSDTVPGIAYAVPGTQLIELRSSNGSAKTFFNVSGDLELESMPDFLR